MSAPDIYAWRATDEQAVCASWIGKQAEAFTLCRRLLARPDIPDDERQRIAATATFGADDDRGGVVLPRVHWCSACVAGHTARPRSAVSLVAGPDRAATEQTLNSFLHCCTDVSRVGRFPGLSMPACRPHGPRDAACSVTGSSSSSIAATARGPAPNSRSSATQIDARFWLHLGQGWRFFAPENLITRLTAVLEAEPQVFQVGINFADAVKLTGTCAPEEAVRRHPTPAATSSPT